MQKKHLSLLCILLAAVLYFVLPVHPTDSGLADGSSGIDKPSINEGTAQSAPTSFLERIKSTITDGLIKFGMDEEAVKLYAVWIVGAPALVLLIIVLMLLRPRRKRSYLENLPVSETMKRSGAARGSLAAAAKPVFSAETDKLSDKQRVLRFFFNLFKNQINASPDAPTELYLIEMRPTCPNETYEMRIQHNGDWISRRMSIGLLGQGGGSRSKCFYVIYDSHMVIKIPADPIKNFFSYNRQIAAEASIVARLSPRECIVPRVSVILKQSYSIPESEGLSSEALEKKYVHLVEVKPAYQEYLKIGPSFAFFMDLAKHFFLSSTLDEIHSGSINLMDEALQNPDLLWDQNGFICRYGEEAGAVCHDLQEGYYRSEKQIRKLVEEAAIVEDIPAFRFRHWFLTHLVGKELTAEKEDLPAALIEKVNKILIQAIKTKVIEVEKYRQNLKNYIIETRFSQHRNQFACLSANTLDLLVWIGAKGLALRDLKPENLFVAGNPDEYPLFLNDTRNFSIGLIDVETAVVIDAKQPGDLPQPQLAGTPLYATPSHLISNTVLHQVYPDLASILHLQDWYAVIAIIFKICTGKNLFPATARVFPEILKGLKLMNPAGPDLEEDFIRINRLFWNSAQAELQEALVKHRGVLTRVEVAIPRALVEDIIKSLHRGIRLIKKNIAYTVEEQSFFTSNEKRQFLLNASMEKIRAMKQKLMQEKQKPKQHKRVLKFFEGLEASKDHLQRKLEAAANLKATGSPIAADQLLEAMFQHVFNAMYLPHWPALKPSKWQGKANVPADIATYQATM